MYCSYCVLRRNIAYFHLMYVIFTNCLSSLLQLTVDGEVVEVQRLFSDELTLSELKVQSSSLFVRQLVQVMKLLLFVIQ